jgi:type VI secretion system protein ImpA
MAREPLLVIDELLVPIAGDEPAGPTSVFFQLRPQFEELRREVTPEQAEETKEEIKNADWRGLERKTKETLTETSKDLRVAGYLLEALVKNYGFAGAHDGLKLLRQLVEQCWDRLNPPVDPEDPDVRGGPFNWMDDPAFGLRFPTTLKLTPLLIVDKDDRANQYSLLQCRPEGMGDAVQEARRQIERAIELAPIANLTSMVEEVKGCLDELHHVTEGLTAKMGKDSPGMNGVRTILEDCRTFLEQILQRRPDSETKSDMGAEPGATGGGVTSPGATRADIYHQLGQAAMKLRELEPHSPIPYLLLRAVELGQMPFPQLMQELVRDANALTELKREFGIKEAPPPSD